MFLSIKNAGRISVLALVVVLAACKPAPAAQTTPTVDPNTIYTAAAKTVQVQLTQDAALTPSATATEEATATLAVPTADTNLPTLPASGSATQPAAGSLTATPLFTIGPIATQAGAKPPSGAPKGYQWISNDPADNAIIETGAKFDIVWTVKNTGTTTWTTDYTYKYVYNDKFSERLSYKLKEDVKAGATTKLIVDAVAPKNPGTYKTWWKLYDPQGVAIGDMDLTIVVVKPGTTPTPPTATPKP